MSKGRGWLVVILCLGLAMACGTEKSRLNVMIIAVDTLRPDHLGCYGYQRHTSPRIDRLAAESILCERCLSAAPWTTPSFATVFTSLYPTQHGATTVHSHMRAGFPTLAEILKRHGYRTGAIVNAPALKPAFKVDRGFDHYHMTPPQGRVADGTTRDALAWIDEPGGEPFFIFVHYFDPHLPYAPPPAYLKRFEVDYHGPIGDSFNMEGFSRVRSTLFEQIKSLSAADWDRIVTLYDAEIAFADSAIGELLGGLAGRGLREKTLIVFLGDHGEEFFEHGGFEHGHSLYEELIHVPLMFSLPGVLPQNARLSRQVRLLDVTPTVLDLLDIPLEAHFEGVSLKPLLFGGGKISPPPSALLPPDASYAEALMHGPERKSISSYPWKLVYEMGTGQRMLFNLDADPGEGQDLASQKPERVSALDQMLYRTMLGISETWYIEMAAGSGSHTFGITVTAERGEMPGSITMSRLLDDKGRPVDDQGVIVSDQSGSVLKIDSLAFKGTLTLAFKASPARVPMEFDLRIDGSPAAARTFLGESQLSPGQMPFMQMGRRSKTRSEGRPPAGPDAPYFMVWFEEGPFVGDTSLKLDEETKKELRSLGYIQ